MTCITSGFYKAFDTIGFLSQDLQSLNILAKHALKVPGKYVVFGPTLVGVAS